MPETELQAPRSDVHMVGVYDVRDCAQIAIPDVSDGDFVSRGRHFG